MPGELDDHTAVRRREDRIYDARLSDDWGVGARLNGGYLLAVVGAALRAESPGKPDPLTLSASFVSPAAPGPAEVTTRPVREGRTVGTVAAELHQDGECRITALATLGRLADLTDDVRTTATPPDLPPPERCVGGSTETDAEVRERWPDGRPRLLGRYDLRLDPAVAGFAVGKPSGRGMLRGWCRLADGREPDPLALLAIVDALPPVTYDLGMLGWAPSVQLTAHLRAEPAPGWLRLHQQTRNLAGGFFEQDCEVWDSTGRLVAQSRQLTMAPRS